MADGRRSLYSGILRENMIKFRRKKEMHYKMEVDVLIDKITDCLIDTRTGEKVDTEYKVRETPIRPKDYKEWKFNWSTTEKNGYHIYELFLKDSDIVQGRISLKIDGGVADVEIVETAPHNYSHKGIYAGVGAHLFAIACQVSLEAGCDGVVAFTSKSDLVGYYMKKLHAVEITPRRMVIFEDAAQILLEKYMRK